MDTLFSTVLTTSLYASIAGIIIIILKALLKNRISPKWHYVIWFVLILKLLIPFGPKSIVSLFNAVPPVSQNINFTPVNDNSQKTVSSANEKATVFSSDSINADLTNQNSLQHTALNFKTIVPYIWILGFLFMMLWLLYTNCSLFRILRKSKVSVPEKIYRILYGCKNKMNVRRNIGIILQDTINTPAIWGIFRPKILLSPSILDLDDKEISYILLHELAHHKRKDMSANYLLFILQAIHWFNPIIWYCFRRLRQDMETAADEMVLTLLNGDEHKEYGKALLSVLESFNTPKLVPKLIGMVDDRKNIERRIKMIKMAEFFKNRKGTATVTGVLCVFILSGILLTNALSEQNTYEIWDYTLQVPSGWEVESWKAPNNLISELKIKKDNLEIGGVQVLGYYAEHGPFLPNHSMTNSKKNIDGLFTEAVLVNLDFQPEAESGVTQNENHLFLIFESEKRSYDIYFNTKYVSEAELIKIAKSFKKKTREKTKEYDSEKLITLKTPYVGNNSKVVNLIDNLPFSKARKEVSLKTDNQPYGITVNYSLMATSLSLEAIEETLRNNTMILFALIDNADEVNFNITFGTFGEGQNYKYTRSQIQQGYERDLREFGKDAETLDVLINSFSLKLSVYPEKYTPAMSSTPGIRISPQYGGTADKMHYSTEFGHFLTWDSSTGKITEYGQTVELPLTTPVYWSPLPDSPNTDFHGTLITVTISNKNIQLGQKQVNITYDGGFYISSTSDEAEN